jgi:aminobenzoyl-glutamate utilization protein B
MLNNHTLADLQHGVMQALGPIEFTEAERAYAAEINAHNPPGNITAVAQHLGLTREQQQQPLIGDIFHNIAVGRVFKASTDVGDLSWRVPVSMLGTTCWPLNAPAHSWGIVASGGTSIGHKGMMYAAKVMSQAAITLYANPDKLQAVRAEFEQAKVAVPYVCPIPDDKQPPYNKHPYR